MNYKANTGSRQPFGRKVKRVSDVNAMGYSPYDDDGIPQQNQMYPNPNISAEMPNAYAQSDYLNQQQYGNLNTGVQPNIGVTPKSSVNNMQYTSTPFPNLSVPNPSMNVFGQPLVQDMAIQYGQQLASSGTTMLKKEVERYIPVNKLKYYFAVDTKYVLTKLTLLFFPFTHSDWSLKYQQDSPVQPRFEINAPDLYIPTLAYITYVLVAGLLLGMQQRFSPEQIGILSSSALAWCIFELCIYSCTLYIAQIETSLRTFDLLAYSGYKFVGIILSVLVSILASRTGYYCCLAYTSFALAFFIIRTLKAQVLPESSSQTTNYYGEVAPTTGHKRRLYFLLFVAGVQPVLSWWLSYHLIGDPVKIAPSSVM